MPYVKKVWVNDSSPHIDNTNLNTGETGIYNGNIKGGEAKTVSVTSQAITLTDADYEQGLKDIIAIKIVAAITGGAITIKVNAGEAFPLKDNKGNAIINLEIGTYYIEYDHTYYELVSGTSIGTLINNAAVKTTPADADMVGLMDSAASNVLKKLSWTNIKATLKTYFDTLYNKYVHPNHSGDVTSVADGAQTIANSAVTLAKMANMPADSLIYRKTAGAGAPEVNTLAQLKTDLAAMPIAGGTFTGKVLATPSADALQIRNIIVGTTDPASGTGSNGDIYIKYIA